MRLYRPAAERGNVRMAWLDARHTFSFGNYYDRAWLGFGPLQVINEDRIAAGRGFAPHPHANMEILTYVLDGELGHKDSMGAEGSVVSGEWQYMSAGTGVTHSEYNTSKEEPLHLMQIWIHTNEPNATPSYAQKRFDPSSSNNKWSVIASPDGRNDSIAIRQDALLLNLRLHNDKSVAKGLDPERLYWLHVVDGEVQVDGQTLGSGDAVGISKEADLLRIIGRSEYPAELLLFDLPQ